MEHKSYASISEFDEAAKACAKEWCSYYYCFEFSGYYFTTRSAHWEENLI